MTLVQEIILYFEIIPLISFLIIGVMKSYIDDKKTLKMEVRKLRKANRIQREIIEKEIFLKSIR